MAGTGLNGVQPDRSDAQDRNGEVLTNLILKVFRLNGALLTAGDTLVGDLGLSSARWQVLGAIEASPVPLPVAHLARNMGLTRQAVQRTVDDMRADGLLHLETNPHHRRAMLVVMTEAGRASYARASDRQHAWVRSLAEGLDPAQIVAASVLLHTLQRRLDGGAVPDLTPLPQLSTEEV